jgi:hypothetical protein
LGEKNETPLGQIGVRPMDGQVISNREGVSAMMMHEALPGIKRFLKPVGVKERILGLTIRCIAGYRSLIEGVEL